MGNVCRKNSQGNNPDNNPLDDVSLEENVDKEKEELDRIRFDLFNDLESFLLDNVLMSVQFFENYERDIETLREKCLEETQLSSHGKKCFNRDTLLDLVSSKVKFNAKHGAKKNKEEVLTPSRMYVVYENVELTYNEETFDLELTKEKPYYRLSVEDCKRKPGYVNLIKIQSLEDESQESSQRSSVVLNAGKTSSAVWKTIPKPMRILTETERKLSLAMSARRSSIRLSTTNSVKLDQIRRPPPNRHQPMMQNEDYWHVNRKEVTKPYPVYEYRINDVPDNSTSIPKRCFQMVTIAAYKDQRRNAVTKTKESDALITDFYLNSSAFKGHFCDVFVEKIGESLDFDNKILNDSILHGPSINIKKHNQLYHITPAFELTDHRSQFYNNYTIPDNDDWPPKFIKQNFDRLELTVIPMGSLNYKGDSRNFEKEWKIEFPKGEKLLFHHMMHAHMRCYIFLLTIYKSFLEIEKEYASFGPEHLANLLFWQVHKDFWSWPEAQPGTTLIRFLRSLYRKLQNRRLRDFFFHQRNVFDDSLIRDLNRVSGQVFHILENPVPYVLIALRNLKFKSNFYPSFDFSKLFKLVTTKSVVEWLNPNDDNIYRQQNTKTEKDEDKVIDSDDTKLVQRVQLRKQIEKEKVRQKEEEKARISVESIDVRKYPISDYNSYRRQEILRMFIPHFIEMGDKSKQYKAYNQALMYLLHAKRLCQLLKEENVEEEVYRHLEKIESLQLKCKKLLKEDAKESDTEVANGEGSKIPEVANGGGSKIPEVVNETVTVAEKGKAEVVTVENREVDELEHNEKVKESDLSEVKKDEPETVMPLFGRVNLEAVEEEEKNVPIVFDQLNFSEEIIDIKL